jgi:acyl carrier protein
MNKEEIFSEIMEIFRRKSSLDWTNIKCDNKPMKYYNVDSLNQIKIVSGIEDRFGIRIRDEEMVEAHSFLKLVELIQSKMATVKTP